MRIKYYRATMPAELSKPPAALRTAIRDSNGEYDLTTPVEQNRTQVGSQV